jgi:16S rRNA processing protein RimM
VSAPLVAVGEVLKPHGVGGEVRVRALTDQPEKRFGRLRECILWNPAGDRREACRVANSRFDGETLLVKIDGLDSPERARDFSGWLLAVDRSRALPPQEGTFYPWQMEGARVETVSGELAGVFAGVESGGPQELWVIVNGDRRHLIPAVPEIVVEVSVADHRIVIDPPEGLLDL